MIRCDDRRFVGMGLLLLGAVCGLAACSGQPASLTMVKTNCPEPIRWVRIGSSPAGFAISGSGPTDVWLVTGNRGRGGQLMRGDGTTWTPVTGFVPLHS